MKRFAFLLLLAAIAHAQTVDEIVAMHVAARGGAAKFAAIHAVRIEGRIKLGAGDYTPLTVLAARPDKFRLEFKMNNAPIIQGYDGKTPWQGDAVATGDSARQVIDQATGGAIAGPLVDYKERGTALTYGGAVKWKARDTILIKVKLKTGTLMNVYLDSKTYFEYGEELFVKLQGKDTTIEETLGDERRFGGVLFPCLFESHVVGQQGGQRLEFQTITINPKIDEALFKLPGTSKSVPKAK